MIDLLIYHLHLLGASYAFTKRWQGENVRSGLMAVALIGLASAPDDWSGETLVTWIRVLFGSQYTLE